MTENKGDLISREALKEALKSNCTPELCHDYNTNWCERCCRTNDFEDLIDNAPTVEPRIEFGTDGQPYRLFMSGGQVVPDTLQGWRYEERPQGEWNYIQAGMCVCPFCGAMPHKDYKNFCAKCGAKMGGKEE